MYDSSQRRLRVLIIEDAATDHALVERYLLRAAPRTDLVHMPDGDAAMSWLRSGAPLPDLILLDLNLPKKDGREVLAEIDLDQRLRIIPIVVISGSDLEIDRNRAYLLGCSSYLLKPGKPDEYRALMEDVSRYWIARNQYAGHSAVP